MHAPHSMTAIFCTLGGLCIQNYSLSDASVVYLMLQLYCSKRERQDRYPPGAQKRKGETEKKEKYWTPQAQKVGLSGDGPPPDSIALEVFPAWATTL